ncbi:MAG: hypothetical protein ACFFAU_16625, partial [Candidatus Hodarchaeota archaeon]
LQNKLDVFLDTFCQVFAKEIANWIGQTSTFTRGVEVAEDVFGPLLPSKTIYRDTNTIIKE